MVSEDTSIIQFLTGNMVDTEQAKRKEFSYILNPDDTIRWLYPKNIKRAYFLNFYSTASFRAKILSYVIKLAFFTKQSSRVKSGDITLSISETSPIAKILEGVPYSGYSIFTGTRGENRKAIIEIHDKWRVRLFVKIALTKTAKALVVNEVEKLSYLNKLSFKKMIVPEVLSSDKSMGILSLSNIKPQWYSQRSGITKLHVQAISELYLISHTKKKWGDLYSLQESKSKLKELLNGFDEVNNLNRGRVQGLANKILSLIDIIDKQDAEVTVAIAHGDFTPWNMYCSKNVLYVFDWELSQDNMPLIFDLIHFVFQSNILIKRSCYAKIDQALKKLLKINESQNLIDKFNIDFNKNYLFYLIYNIAYYLDKYIRQKQLHEQAFWLIDVWEDAVDDALKKQGILFN